MNGELQSRILEEGTGSVASPRSAGAGRWASTRPDSPINILVVDDEPKNFQVMEAILDDPSYRLVRAQTADEALLALVAEEFALLILDVRMPDMTGFELAEMIKERKKTARVPIIFLTAYYNEDQHVLEGYGTGAVDYLHKPVTPAILRSKVAVFAELHRKNRDWALATESLSAEVAERCRVEEQLRELNETLEQRVNERTEALRASEARKEAVLQSALDAVITMDHRGNFVEFNPAAERIFGYRREEVLGKSLADLIVPMRLREKHADGLAKFLASGEGPFLNRQIELSAVRADGREFPAEIAVIRIPGSDPPMFTAFLRDVSLRRQTEAALADRAAELVRADRSKDEFLAMLAHELRNPLAPLRNAVEVLRSGDFPPDEKEEALRIVSRQIGNMGRMIDDLLDVSRITQGKIELRRRTVALGPILAAAVDLIRPASAAHGQSVLLDLPADEIYIDADPTRVEQIFGNLLANACKFSGEGSSIRLTAEVTAESRGQEVVVRVKDNGTGIDSDLLPHVFDLFVQASRSLDRSHGGLGIGLTLVQRLVRLHGGAVEARSDGPGAGAEFVVKLPTLPGGTGEKNGAEGGGAASTEKALRMMIVDDNVDAARTLAMLQQRRGHDTRIAFSGPDALTLASEFHPDAVLLDIGLPGMDGFEVARQLRQLPEFAGCLLVAMSGYGRKSDLEAAKHAGFDHYLVKPIDLGELSAVLRASGCAGPAV